MEDVEQLWALVGPYSDSIIAAAVGITVYFVLGQARAILLKRLDQFHTADQFAVPLAIVRSTSRLLILALAIYGATKTAELQDNIVFWLDRAVIVLFGLQIGLWGSAITKVLVERSSERSARQAKGVFRLISVIARFVVWSAVALFVLDNLGVNVTALVAGLGVGGIAIGLALQNILSDLFASLAIVLDKPFEVEDFVVFDEFAGTVESIGLKTTRLRSLSGEQIVCANGDLLATRIRNYKRMSERRIVMKVGIIYDTPPGKVERALTIIKEVVNAQENARLDRCHFQALGAYSLDFETVYWVKSPDYNSYMDIQEAINFALYRRFAEEGLAFAFPTQTIHTVAAPPA